MMLSTHPDPVGFLQRIRASAVTGTKVKICGITSVDDGLAAVDAGADAIGLVFYRGSKRFVELELATEIVAAVGPFVTTVGLFVNEQIEYVERAYQHTGIHMVQLHGDEDSTYCGQLKMPFIKAIRMAPDLDPRQAIEGFPRAAAFLFDAWEPDQYGGTGTGFDWLRISDIAGRATILAGGLSADNVGEAVAMVAPYAVDVSGGVETSPGRKDALLMQRFVKAAKSV